MKPENLISGSIIIAALIIGVAIMSKPTQGRYQMCGVPGHAYIYDTTTGQVWENFATPSEGRSDNNFNKPK